MVELIESIFQYIYIGLTIISVMLYFYIYFNFKNKERPYEEAHVIKTYCLLLIVVVLGGFYNTINIFTVIWTFYTFINLGYFLFKKDKVLKYNNFLRFGYQLLCPIFLYLGGFFS